VALVSQLAFHPMFKISTIHQHTSFIPNRRSRRSLGFAYAQYAICHSMRALGHPLFKQFRCKVIQSKRFRLLPLSLITFSDPCPIIRYTISINALTSSVSVTSEVFLWHC